MRRSVDLPAPFAPSSASASPSRTSKERPAKATAVGFSNGCKNVRQPLRVGGNSFSRDSMAIAGSGTQGFIACLLCEDKSNNGAGGVRSAALKTRSRIQPSLEFLGSMVWLGHPAEGLEQ